jgi:hypothetical protein
MGKQAHLGMEQEEKQELVDLMKNAALTFDANRIKVNTVHDTRYCVYMYMCMCMCMCVCVCMCVWYPMPPRFCVCLLNKCIVYVSLTLTLTPATSAPPAYHPW